MSENTQTKVNKVHAHDAAFFGTTDRWSVAHADSITSIDGARDYAKQSRVEIDKGVKYGTQATVAAALAADAAKRVGYLVAGNTKDSGPGTVTFGQYVKTQGKNSQSLVTKWLHVANMLRCGIDPFAQYYTADGQEFDLWNILLNKGGVTKVADLGEKGATPDEIIARLLDFFGPDGKRKQETVAKKGKEPEQEQDEDKTEGTEDEAPTSAHVVKTLMAVRDVLKTGGPDFLTAGDASIVREMLAEITTLVGEDKAPARKRTRKSA